MSLYAVATPPPSSDTEPPAVAITGPTAGSHVSGNVTVTADASDNVGVTRVDFYLDAWKRTIDGYNYLLEGTAHQSITINVTMPSITVPPEPALPTCP